MVAERSSVARYVGRLAGGAAKRTRQRLRASSGSAAPLFVVGCQRSGTTMLLEVLERSLDTRVFHEQDRQAFAHWRLRPAADRGPLLTGARCRWVVFKPLQDSQHCDHMLEESPGARLLWVVRRYQDVVRSWTAKWGDGLHDALRSLARDEACDHWMAERMPADRRQRVAELFHDDLSIPSNAALRWVLRNEIYFDRGLERQGENVSTVHYEDLVGDPVTTFGGIFEDLGLEFDRRLVDHVSPRRVPAPSVEIDPRIREHCEELTSRLHRAAPPRLAAA